MLAVLRQRNFALLFTGAVISQAGDLILFVALPFWIYRLTGSVAATGANFLALTVPRLLLSPVAGVFVDRWDRRRVMIVADLLRAAIVGGMLLVRSADMVWLIIALAFLESCVSRFFFPARTAALPLIVGRERLLQANATMSFGEATAQLGGPALGGVLVALWGPHGAIAVDALSYLVSAVLIALIAMPHRSDEPPQAADHAPAARRAPGEALRSVWRELLEGAAVVRARPPLRMLFTSQAIFALGNGITNVLVVVVVSDIWHAGARELGWFMSAMGIGALLGGPTAAAVTDRLSARSLLAFGGILAGTILFVSVDQPSVYVAIGLNTVVGVLNVWLSVGMGTLLQLASDDRNRGRVSSLLMTVGGGGSLLSALLTSAVTGVVGVRPVISLGALLFVAGGAVALLGRDRAMPTPAAGEAAESRTPAEAKTS